MVSGFIKIEIGLLIDVVGILKKKEYWSDREYSFKWVGWLEWEVGEEMRLKFKLVSRKDLWRINSRGEG